jgi:hypothetical protein
MKFYVAGKFQNYEVVRAFADRLRDAGHEITYDWTRTDEFDEQGHPIVSQYQGETDDSGDEILSYEAQKKYAHLDADGVAEADALVLFATPNVTGALIETGMALGYGIPVIVIDPARWTIFYALDLVTVVKDEEEALEVIDKGLPSPGPVHVLIA